MARRSRRRPALTRGPAPAGRDPYRAARHAGLRPASALPPRVKGFLVCAGLALVAFAVWVTFRLLAVDSRPVAILLIALSYLGAVVVASAVLTVTRMAYSLHAVPYLLGRGVRRLLGRR